ncbi:hypothetical protein NDU88_000039 [Pleurodeles waltl]|uniref:Uncharacterized protein n=1 Tax=Pleurodeles waltl TaxID=8319 RepID=A0AAV7TF55_PLEWA|nr:hypothetical protein NDU88_000039 [Pleurodeles waltl]
MQNVIIALYSDTWAQGKRGEGSRVNSRIHNMNSLKQECILDSVRDRVAVRGEGTELDFLHCAWKYGARQWAYSFVAGASSGVNNGQGQSKYGNTANADGPIHSAKFRSESAKRSPGPLEKRAEPTRVQILAAIESSTRAMQTQIAAKAVDVNLLRDDLRMCGEKCTPPVKYFRVTRRLDRFLLPNDGSLDVRRFVYQVRFSSGHAPLLLECETHIPKPAIPLWRLRPDLLGDPEYKQDLQGVLNGYFSENWGTAMIRGIEWEALKVVIRGKSLSKTYGIRKHLDRELTQQEDVLAALQRQVDNGNASESDCLEVGGRIVDLWDGLDKYVRRNYRLRLLQQGDPSGVCWLGSSGGSVPFPSSRCSAVLLEKRF